MQRNIRETGGDWRQWNEAWESDLQRLQKRNERLLVRRRDFEPEFVALDGPWAAVITLRHVILLEPRRVQPLLERIGGSRVAEAVAKPDAAERRDFVEPRAAPGLRSQHRVGSH